LILLRGGELNFGGVIAAKDAGGEKAREIMLTLRGCLEYRVGKSNSRLASSQATRRGRNLGIGHRNDVRPLWNDGGRTGPGLLEDGVQSFLPICMADHSGEGLVGFIQSLGE